MSFALPTLCFSLLTLLTPAATDPIENETPASGSAVEASAARAPLESGTEIPGLSQDSAAEAQAAAQEAMKKREHGTLKGAITAGASVSFGNTSVKKANVNAAADYLIDDQQRVSGLFDWLFSEEKDPITKNSNITQRRVRGALQYDRFFSDKLYGFARADALHDGLQSLNIRAIGSIGVGYQIMEEKDVTWNGEVGLAYVHTDIKGAAATAIATGRKYDDPTGEVSARVATKYWRQINEDLAYTFSAEWYPSLEDTDAHVVYASNQLDYQMGKGFTTSLRWEFDYNNQPGFRANGDRLDRLDHRLIWGLGYTF